MRKRAGDLEQTAHQGARRSAHLATGRTDLAIERIPGLELSERIGAIAALVAGSREHVFHRTIHKDRGRALLKHLERGIDAQLESMGAKDTRAHAVNGRNPRIVDRQGLFCHAGLNKSGTHALANLRRGVFGKCDSEHLVQMLGKRTGLRGERPQDTARKGEGLARAGARRHKQRAIERRHDLALLRHQC